MEENGLEGLSVICYSIYTVEYPVLVWAVIAGANKRRGQYQIEVPKNSHWVLDKRPYCEEQGELKRELTEKTYKCALGVQVNCNRKKEISNQRSKVNFSLVREQR
jgi:hypothetical protein